MTRSLTSRTETVPLSRSAWSAHQGLNIKTLGLLLLRWGTNGGASTTNTDPFVSFQWGLLLPLVLAFKCRGPPPCLRSLTSAHISSASPGMANCVIRDFILNTLCHMATILLSSFSDYNSLMKINLMGLTPVFWQLLERC